LHSVSSYFLGASDHRALHSFPTRRSSDLRSRTSDLRTVLSLTPSRRAIADAVMPSLFKTVAPLEGRAAGAQITSSSRSRPISSRSEEHTSELQSRFDLVCRLLLEKKKNTT